MLFGCLNLNAFQKVTVHGNYQNEFRNIDVWLSRCSSTNVTSMREVWGLNVVNQVQIHSAEELV